MKTPKHVQVGVVAVAAVLSMLSTACEHEEKVTAHLRKQACERVSGEMLKGCEAGADAAYRLAKAMFQNGVKADPVDVFLGTLAFCVDQYMRVEPHSDRLLGCNLGAAEGITFSRQVIEQIRVDRLKESQAKGFQGADSGVLERYLALPVCVTSAELPQELAAACIGIAPLTQDQLIAVTSDVGKAHEKLIADGRAAKDKGDELMKEVDDERRKIAAARIPYEAAAARLAPLENALRQTSADQRAQATAIALIGQLERDRDEMPGKIRRAKEREDLASDEADAYRNEYDRLERQLSKAKRKREDAKVARDWAGRRYEEKSEKLRREREARERLRREAEEAKLRAAEEARRRAEAEERRHSGGGRGDTRGGGFDDGQESGGHSGGGNGKVRGGGFSDDE